MTEEQLLLFFAANAKAIDILAFAQVPFTGECPPGQIPCANYRTHAEAKMEYAKAMVEQFKKMFPCASS